MARFVAVTSKDGEPLRLSRPLVEDHKGIDGYVPAPGLIEAIDVAMLLGVPLLLTGEPGTGKTRAAYWLAKKLGVDKPKPFDVKSTSTGRDLLYSFDEIARFRDSAPGSVHRPLVRYLRFSPLGEAILRAAGGQAILTDLGEKPLEGEEFERHEELIAQAFGADQVKAGAVRAHWLLPDEPKFASSDPEHRVVLIDELDKAPRDTPNDLLAEIDNMAFAIPELGVRVSAGKAFRPIAIITSNSEKSLPEPFLRRCAYFDIPMPDKQLPDIVAGAITSLKGSEPLVADAISYFAALRLRGEIRKKPGTAELLAWIEVLLHRAKLDPRQPLREVLRGNATRLDALLGALVKSPDDLKLAREVLNEEFGSSEAN
ncbi:AAA family ATPase [Sphingomonas psychrotolerans]|uniref:AAA family ATPase n=1 Tax=Sphingomonas psychrotolerans TaxID=1327635 RepID=A0A2K8MF61_9SPHN|nr:MoxR family ATPase [Sphingomonas psychrotolerans]ATY32528.1 AAA family ATPase [Sphingomonas psychrotolerans]